MIRAGAKKQETQQSPSKSRDIYERGRMPQQARWRALQPASGVAVSLSSSQSTFRAKGTA